MQLVPSARFQLFAAKRVHGCVAPWRVPIPMRLSAPTRNALSVTGDTLSARGLRRGRRELSLRRADVAEQMGVGEKALIWWERDEREPYVSAYCLSGVDGNAGT